MYQVQGLTKRYGKHAALENLSLNFEAKTFVALLGRNGSGKSTLMRLLAQQDMPNEGDILLDGISLKNPRLHLNDRCLYINEDQTLPFYHTLEHWSKTFAQLKPRYDQQLFRTLAAQFDLDTNKQFSQLSRGQKVKALFALQAPNRPDIYLLDEITAVLDSGSRLALLQFLKAERARGAFVMLSTNIANELQGFATHLCLIQPTKVELFCSTEEFDKHFKKNPPHRPRARTRARAPGAAESRRQLELPDRRKPTNRRNHQRPPRDHDRRCLDVLLIGKEVCVRNIWLTAFKKSMRLTFFWILLFAGAFIDDGLQLDSSLLLGAVLFIPLIGLFHDRGAMLPFARVHAKNTVDFFKFDISLVFAVLALNVVIGVIYGALFVPRLVGLFHVFPIQLFWSAVTVLLLCVGTSASKTATNRSPYLRLLGIYLFFGIVVGLFLDSTALAFFFVAIVGWWSFTYRTPHVLESLHLKLRQRLFVTGFASLTLMMALSIAISVARNDSFLKWHSRRAPASMGERDRY